MQTLFEGDQKDRNKGKVVKYALGLLGLGATLVAAWRFWPF